MGRGESKFEGAELIKHHDFKNIYLDGYSPLTMGQLGDQSAGVQKCLLVVDCS